MSDLIDRQAAIDALIRKRKPVDNGDGTTTIMMMTDNVIKETLESLPSAQPERKTGKWLPDCEYDGEDEWCFYTCSCCEYQSDDQFKYCPSCGADMREQP